MTIEADRLTAAVAKIDRILEAIPEARDHHVHADPTEGEPDCGGCLVQTLDDLRDILAPDTCMCGSPMDQHTPSDNHSPVAVSEYLRQREEPPPVQDDLIR